jgi:hypothetical protein
MTLDPQLVARARAAAKDLADAEQAEVLCRAEYHTSVRRLHLAGGSLREIADMLSLSHQRVQQIVSAAGGSWWRRMWRTRKVGPDAACTWCGRPARDVAKLIAGPNVYICDACVEAAERTLAGQRGDTGAFARADQKSAAGRCGFCARRAGQDRSLITAAPGHICTECLRTCREILT